MKKKILSLILAVILCFLISACVPHAPEESIPTPSATPVKTSVSTPLLYKVTDASDNIIWLFGTIHVGREDFFPLPDYALNALYESDALAVEFDLTEFETDFSAQTACLQKLTYSDGSTIDDHIPKDLYDDSVKTLKENSFYNKMFDYYMPSMWSSLIDNVSYMKLGIDVNSGVDRHLIKLAKEKNIEVLDVESAEFQYNMLAEFSPQLQELILRESVKSYNESSETKSGLDELMEAWFKGDEKVVTDLINEDDPDLTDDEKLIYNEYLEKLITSRNKTMPEYAENTLKSGKTVFMAVGMGHIVGDGGVKDSLEKLGYKVEVIR